MESNQINNIKLKENACNIMTSMLLNAKIISEEEIKDIQFEFGYIYKKDNNEIEALIKMTCNDKMRYFAIQHNKVKVINISEQQYSKIVEDMKQMHKCLQEGVQEDAFDIAFFKNVSMKKVEFGDGLSEAEGKEKLANIIKTANDNKEEFEDSIISACQNTLAFDITTGDNEEDDELFDNCFKESLLQPISREEYQEIVNKCNADVYKATREKNNKSETGGYVVNEADFKEFYIEKMRKIVDYAKIFRNSAKIIVVEKNRFSIEISDGFLFDNPIVVVFDYNMKVIDVQE